MEQRVTNVTVVTWNVQGSAGLDLAGVADVIAGATPDVVVMQEVGWWQSWRLSRRLRMNRKWAFKHFRWPGPEGLAVLTPHRIVSSRHFVLRKQRWSDWRRRIAISAEIGRGEEHIHVINVHLSPHDDVDARRVEAGVVLDAARQLPRLPLIAGDCNDMPGRPGPADLAAAGWTDAWMLDRLVAVDGATNWTAGERHGRPPTQRLDYVFVPPGWLVIDATVLATADRHDWFAQRSDHLPLAVVASPPGARDE